MAAAIVSPGPRRICHRHHHWHHYGFPFRLTW
jgi:hypothetical protein